MRQFFKVRNRDKKLKKKSKNLLRHEILTSYTNMYAKICKNRPITSAYTHSCLVCIDRHTHTDRQTDGQKFYSQFFFPDVQNVEKKSFSLIKKKGTHRPNSNICPWRSLWTYNNICNLPT